MCGIIGFISKKNIELDIDVISHRGPDNKSNFKFKNCHLGHTRLSIQDLSSKSNQPFISRDNNIVISYNGEIYNHWDLRSELEKSNIKFKTTSDTETIAEGLSHKGIKFLNDLNGIFSIAILNKKENTITLCRDRFGVKPLYYCYDYEKLLFSSELKSLKKYGKGINLKSIANYISFLWSSNNFTPFNNIHKVLPGEIKSFDIDDLKITDHQTLLKPIFNKKLANLKEKDLIELLDSKLRKAVERQLLSDVPIGFFLSGGLDSSLLVAIAKDLNPEKIFDCFTIDTNVFSKTEGFSDDLFYARLVSEYLGVNLEVIKSDIDIIKDFDKIIWHLDEPQADPAPFNVRNISKRAKELNYKVLIGGTAGDDIFSGYKRHELFVNQKILNIIPNFIYKFLNLLTNRIKLNSSFFRRIKKFLEINSIKNKYKIFKYFEWLKKEEVVKLFRPEFRNQIISFDFYEYFKLLINQIPDETHNLNKILHLEMSTFLVDHNLNYTDKMGMSEGVEIRVPYLDNDLVEFAYSIDPNFKYKDRKLKYILKKVAEKYLPKEVIYRQKAGFGAPVRKWIINDLDKFISRRLNINNPIFKEIFDYKNVFKLIERNKNGYLDASYSIWAILAIDSWYRQFYKSKNL